MTKRRFSKKLCKEGSVKSYIATIKEEHYTVCSEFGREYLFNKTTDRKKCAEIIADNNIQASD